MSSPVEFSPRAIEDLAAIFGDLASVAGEGVAKKWRGKFIAAFERLEMWPNSGSPRPELGEGRRIIVVRPYLIVYRPGRNSSLVIRILHGAQHLPTALLDREN